MSEAVSHPNANAIRFPIDTADLAKARPIWRAAQINMTRCPSDSPKGDNVFPVPVGAVYNTSLGLVGSRRNIENNSF